MAEMTGIFCAGGIMDFLFSNVGCVPNLFTFQTMMVGLNTAYNIQHDLDMTWFCSPQLLIFEPYVHLCTRLCQLTMRERSMLAVSMEHRQDMEENETNVTAEMADDDDDDASAPAPPAEEQLKVDEQMISVVKPQYGRKNQHLHELHETGKRNCWKPNIEVYLQHDFSM